MRENSSHSSCSLACDQLGRELDRHHHHAIVVGNDDIAGHHQHIAAGDRHIHRERHDGGLRMEVGRHAPHPQRQIELLGVRIIANAAIDHHAGAAAALEVGQHHLAEYAAAHVAARVDHHDIAGLGMIQHMAVQLLLGVGIFVDADTDPRAWA